jgi:ParB family chromosome partitioning protein
MSCYLLANDILLLPGWQNSGPSHWQSLWEQRHGDHRVEQHDWMKPLRGDWVARLEDEVLADEPGGAGGAQPGLHPGRRLGRAFAQHRTSVKGALLVAPGDVERDDLRQLIPGWAPIVRSAAVPACWWPAATIPIAKLRAGRASWPATGARSSSTPATAATSTPNPAWPAGPKATAAERPLKMTRELMVTKKPKGLGRGLEALLGPTLGEGAQWRRRNGRRATPARHARTLLLDDMVPGMYQPRTRMDEGALYELAESIKAQGIMQPILVRRLDAESAAAKNAKYEIIAGERRFRAAKLAGLDSVPVLVRDVPNEAAAAMSLIENIQREDLNPLEEAQGLQRLVKEFGLTHEQAAQAVGRSRSAASNLLRLLNLADPVQTMLMAGDIDMGHARALLALDRATQITAANQIAAKKLSVREAEALVKKIGAEFSLALARRKKAKVARPAPHRGRTGRPADREVEVRVKKRTKRGEERRAASWRFTSARIEALNGLIERIRRGINRRAGSDFPALRLITASRRVSFTAWIFSRNL